MADKKYQIDFEMTDGSVQSVEFTAPQGEPGYTPVKGEDYFTEADKQEIAELTAPLVEVPQGGGGSSEWVELVNVTLEEAASFDQTVDYSYNEYILAFVVPNDTTTLSSGRGAFLGVQNVLYYQNIASNASYAFKFIAHGRKITDNTMIASLVKVMQNGSQIDKSIHQGSSYVIAPTLVEHSNGRMYIEGALPAGTVIVIYAR